MSDTNPMFQVVPENYSEAKEKSTSKLDAKTCYVYRERALADGYGETVVEAALDVATEAVESYADFEDVIDSVIRRMNDEKAKEEQKARRLKESVNIELDKLRRMQKPAEHLTKLIYKYYNTTAVTALEMLYETEHDERLNLEVYEEPVYSLIMQIKEQWIEDLINDCLAKWENNPVVDGYIEKYLNYLGTPEEQYEQAKMDLISFLPENIQNESSPVVYKQFKAVQLILQENSGENYDASEEVLRDEANMTEYMARFEGLTEEGVPFEAARAEATEATYNYYTEDDCDESKDFSDFVKTAGQFVGKAVNLKCTIAKTFEDAMYEGMGEYADTYRENREKIKERKAEIRARKAEMRHEREMANLAREEKEAEWEHEQKMEEARHPKQQQYYDDQRGYNRTYGDNRDYNRTYNRDYGRNGRNYDSRYNRRYDAARRDFAPQIPIPVMMGVVHLVVFLLVWIMFGTPYNVVCGVGLVVALFGFIRTRVHEPNAVPMMVGGYAVAGLGILFGIM